VRRARPLPGHNLPARTVLVQGWTAGQVASTDDPRLEVGFMSAEALSLHEQIKQSVALLRRHL
jgi:hypothetical protein